MRTVSFGLSSSASSTQTSLFAPLAWPDSEPTQSRVCGICSTCGPRTTKKAFENWISALICCEVLLPVTIASISSYLAVTLVVANALFKKSRALVCFALCDTNIWAILIPSCLGVHVGNRLGEHVAKVNRGNLIMVGI